MLSIAHKTDTESLWLASVDYAEMAAKTLVRELPEDNEDPESALELLVLRLKTAFLFPLLEERDRLLLEGAYLQTKIVTVGVNLRKGAVSEALLIDAEVNYIDARRTVQSKLFSKITALQRKIVNEYYFKVRFSE